ncbi:hypothetical protein PENSPDRAFT_150369 [Peniophora sp. CONT]|nr:hypothetical protein PENSPDRAFT_150369 [Peniophora sp. CONT]
MADGAVQEDPDFYITDELYVFRVEKTLFRVHRSLLVRHSEVFKDMFVDGPPSPSTKDGSSAENPIILESVSAFDFKALLKIIYKSAESDFALAPEEWLAVLCIAHRYRCPGFHERALRYLKDGFKAHYGKTGHGPLLSREDAPVSDAVRILAAAESRGIAMTYLAQPVLSPMWDIVMRGALPSVKECQLLSPKLVAQVAYVRESRLWNANGSREENPDWQCTKVLRFLWPALYLK